MPRATFVPVALALLVGGCYMDVSAGAARTAGGVQGYGWEIGLTGGVAWDIQKLVRPGVGFDASMSHTKASDGKFGVQGFSYHARADIGLAAPSGMSAEELMKRHGLLAGGDIEKLRGITGQTRLVLDYGQSRNDELHFVSPGDPMRYIGPLEGAQLLPGHRAQYNWKGTVQISYSIGPTSRTCQMTSSATRPPLGFKSTTRSGSSPVFRRRNTGFVLGSTTIRRTRSSKVRPSKSASRTSGPTNRDINCKMKARTLVLLGLLRCAEPKRDFLNGGGSGGRKGAHAGSRLRWSDIIPRHRRRDAQLVVAGPDLSATFKVHDENDPQRAAAPSTT
ncbi:MAG: hypothetical protein IPQ07_36955 [Myxococcales bacterium]|nr:hypothetical protein [Myxococcales bacterium]